MHFPLHCCCSMWSYAGPQSICTYGIIVFSSCGIRLRRSKREEEEGRGGEREEGTGRERGEEERGKRRGEDRRDKRGEGRKGMEKRPC